MPADGLGLLLPADLSAWVAAGLVGLSFVTSLLTGALGLGGGVLMLAVLAAVLPPAVVLPVHGMVQVGSNAGRAALLARHVDRSLVWPFLVGTAIGVTVGAQLVVQLSRPTLQLVIGLFVLFSTWTPKLKPALVPARAFVLVGLVTAFANMFVGAVGPLMAAFINPDRLGRHGSVATHSAFMTLQHAFKVAAFTAVGFPLLPWVPLMALMIAVGFLGTLVGKRFLDRAPERAFAWSFKLILTALAIDLVIQAILDLRT